MGVDCERDGSARDLKDLILDLGKEIPGRVALQIPVRRELAVIFVGCRNSLLEHRQCQRVDVA